MKCEFATIEDIALFLTSEARGVSDIVKLRGKELSLKMAFSDWYCITIPF